MELISVHVAKTAGRSFFRILTEIYGASVVLEDYRGKPYELCQYHSTASNILIDKLPKTIKVIHGHFSAVKYINFFPQTRMIVWIRNPISRLISHYHYLTSKQNIEDTLHRQIHEEEMSFMDFARQPLMKNHMTKSYAPLDLFDKFFFVGIMENFDEDVKSLSRLMKWPPVFVPKDNTSKAKNYEEFALTAREIEELTLINDQDFKLYQMAVERRNHARKD